MMWQTGRLTPDFKTIADFRKDTGLGYNVQAVVDAQHHLIVAHEVTNIGNDRSQISTMARQAQEATGVRDLTAIADRGYFKGEEILACEAAGVTPLVPKPLTSGFRVAGRQIEPNARRHTQKAIRRFPALSLRSSRCRSRSLCLGLNGCTKSNSTARANAKVPSTSPERWKQRKNQRELGARQIA